MYALSLYQPWASLLAHGLKKVETRSWKYRGPALPLTLAIHASKKPMRSADLHALLNDPRDGIHWRDAMDRIGCPLGRIVSLARWTADDNLPRGWIVGVGTIRECLRTDVVRSTLSAAELAFGDYSVGRFAWLFEDLRALPEPVPAKGSLGIWTVPADVTAKVEEQLR